ncbi:hypothetical protein I203_107244 [Kwoniella mangroviensis CBS 8507]|uniref:hypothetical protein n=1 Tax=Kwoniella mangroviensis CBS 8507 TaxID=1296122 RepID=UPI00080CCA89|nr:uncharacterized protein I203_01993 [Kwoniella mangroviensis CBS 8507]OCF68610.1 hypothetical protein I203_01993 [Kwoniella mangroviensis CBS 8507]
MSSTKKKSKSKAKAINIHDLTQPILFSDQIIQRILSYIPTNNQSTLASCALVNKQFNRIATPLLWRWLDLSSATSTDDGSEDGTDTAAPLDTSHWTKEHLEMVKVLSIDTHKQDWCSAFVQFDMPNLETLRLTVGRMYGGIGRVHSVQSSPPPSQTRPSSSSTAQCPLIQNLKPKDVVYRETPSSSFYLDPSNLCPSIWSEVETLIILIPPVGANKSFVRNKDLIKLVPKLKKVIWIFDPSQVDLKSKYNTGNYDHGEIDFISSLLLKNQKVRFEIVNCGCTALRFPKTYRGSIEDAHDSYQESFIKNYWDELEEAAYRDKQSNAKNNKENTETTKSEDEDDNDDDDDDSGYTSFDFYSIEEFVEKKEWYRWFGPEEIVRWKKVNEEIVGGKKKKSKGKK